MIVQPPFLFGSKSENNENKVDGDRLLGVLMAITTAILGGFQSTVLHYLNHIHSIILVFWTGVIGILGAQSFTSLMADLHQDTNNLSSFSRCLNGTFP